MEIMRLKQLTGEQRAQISSVVEECQRQGVQLTFPFDLASSFYILCDPKPVSVLALALPQPDFPDEGAECAAFTRPEYQNRGYFTALFREALKEAGELDLYFFADPGHMGARMTLDAIGADFIDSEYRMELNLNHIFETVENPRLICRVIDGLGPEQEPALTFSFYFSGPSPSEKGDLAGNAHAALYGDRACLYGFELCREYRGRGLGFEALVDLISRLKELEIRTLFLHVSESNAAAVSLYKKAGFRVTETLSCYLY